jgi:single-stranded DNA-binding protein
MLTGWAKERQWETKEGEKRTRIEVIADDIAGIPKPGAAAAPAPQVDDPWSTDAPF